jgi:hypothetical protein
VGAATSSFGDVAALTPDGPFALYELSSRGPTLRELFEELFNALNPERPDYPEH